MQRSKKALYGLIVLLKNISPTSKNFFWIMNESPNGTIFREIESILHLDKQVPVQLGPDFLVVVEVVGPLIGCEIQNTNSSKCPYFVFLKRLSVRGSHSVAHNKTHAENVASEGSQTVVLKIYRLI